MTANQDHARSAALGATAAHVEWAISAIMCGETDRALEYLAKAQRALQPVVPTVKMGGTDLYVPGIPMRSVA